MTYTGLVRILDTTGVLLTVGEADLVHDQDGGNWNGTLRVLDGTGVAGKALVVKLEIGGHCGEAQLKPLRVEQDTAISSVYGLGRAPF
jgi:hypothetical protein